MTLFILSGTGSTSSTRIYILALITLVLVCSFSYCSSSSASSFDSSKFDIGNNVDIDENINGENNYYYRLPFRRSSSAIDHLNADEHRILSKNYLLNLLLKSALTQREDRPHRRYEVHVNNRRYAPQSFHAMRG